MKGRQHSSVAAVRALLDPRNVAILGASDRPGSWSRRVANTLRRCSFKGVVYPVNPRTNTVWGERCWPDLRSLPETPDHIIVLIPGAAAIEALREAAAAGARSATIFSSGFGEGGDPDGLALAAQLRRAIAETGLAVSGPNCMGNIAAPFGFASVTDERVASLPPGPVALLGQSGGVVTSLFRALRGRGVQPGYALTTGNELGLTSADYIRFFAQDENTRAIACFIEAIRDPAGFLEACALARDAGKPIVAVKIGGSEASRAAALAHTGSLAGSLECFDAAVEPLGVVRVDTLDQLVETTEYFARAPAPRGPRLGAITFSGGLKGLMLESAQRSGLNFPQLSASTIEKLRAIAGVGTSLGNPLDAGFSALSSAQAYFAFVQVMLEDPNIDALLVQEELPQIEGQNLKAANLRTVDDMALASGKPVAVVSMASYMFTDYTRRFREGFPHLPVLQEVDNALRAVAAAGRWGRMRASAVETRLALARPQGADALLARAVPGPDGRRILGESDSKALLALYGVPSPREIVARTADAAKEAAASLGYPVVLKTIAAGLVHKSEVGGVLLGLRDAEAVSAGFDALQANLARSAPTARFEGALVAQMIEGGLELVLGAQRDPEVGPVIMFGAGGVLLELAKDVAFGPLVLSAARARKMVASTSAGRLLAGYRGAPASDVEALVQALLSFSELVQDLADEVESIDVNPLVALPSGVCALDAVIVLRAPPPTR